MTMSRKKLVVTCGGFPPLVIGSPVLLANLFRAYRGDCEAVVGWEYGAMVDPAFTPPCKTHYLRFKPAILQRVVQRFKRLHCFFIKWFVYFQLRRLKPGAVFAACTPDSFFFTASFMACRRLKIPFWGHMHDLWTENTPPGGFQRGLAEHWEPIVFREADKIFCMTPAQAGYYKAKHGRECAIIPHCVPAEIRIPESLSVRTTPRHEKKQIVYTGNISRVMNLDAVREFVKAVDRLPPNYHVRILAGRDIERFKTYGVHSERIDYGWVSREQSRTLIGEADVLFLPLSFKDCSAEEVRTVFSTKTMDYLVSGVPILVYSPPDSFHSRSAKEAGWGYVVDREDPELLAQRLQELANDHGLRERTVIAALAEARRRDPHHWAKCIEEEFCDLAREAREPCVA
jgi:glycosyltransferase involved in cell wall biosynthesis